MEKEIFKVASNEENEFLHDFVNSIFIMLYEKTQGLSRDVRTENILNCLIITISHHIVNCLNPQKYDEIVWHISQSISQNVKLIEEEQNETT